MKIANYFVTPRVVFPIILSFLLAALVGCSGGSSFSSTDDDAVGSITPQKELGELNETEALFYTETYAGYMVVILDGALVEDRVDTSKSTYGGGASG